MNVATATDVVSLPRADAFLSHVPLPLMRVFYPLGFPVRIATNHEAVLEAASQSWGENGARHNTPELELQVVVTESESVECPPSPVMRFQGHLITTIADTQNHAVTDIKAGVAYVWLSRGALAYSGYVRYYFVEAAALCLISTSFVTPLHAACVSRYGRGMLLFGGSGAGKSTLAYACARAGWKYTTDDGSYLVRDAEPPRVIGNSRQVRFRPTASALFPEIRGYDITPRAEGKPSIEVAIDELLPEVTRNDEATIHLLIFLKRHESASPKLIPLAMDAALRRLKVGEGLGTELEQFHNSCLEHLADAQAYEFHYSELQPAIECLDALAHEAARQI